MSNLGSFIRDDVSVMVSLPPLTASSSRSSRTDVTSQRPNTGVSCLIFPTILASVHQTKIKDKPLERMKNNLKTGNNNGPKVNPKLAMGNMNGRKGKDGKMMKRVKILESKLPKNRFTKFPRGKKRYPYLRKNQMKR